MKYNKQLFIKTSKMCTDLVYLQERCGRVHLLSGAVGNISAVTPSAAGRGGSVLMAYNEFPLNRLQ